VIVNQYSIKNYGFIDEEEIFKKGKLLFRNKMILLNKIFHKIPGQRVKKGYGSGVRQDFTIPEISLSLPRKRNESD